MGGILDQLLKRGAGRGQASQGRRPAPAVSPQVETRLPRPYGCDWLWRPEPWQEKLPDATLSKALDRARLSADVQLFHDGKTAKLDLRQQPRTGSTRPEPYALQMALSRFDGSFLSLIIQLPEDAITGLTRHHLLRMEYLIESASAVTLYARLNIRHGPNVEQMVHQLSPDAAPQVVEYDLAYARLNEKRITEAWLDLIIETGEDSSVTLGDITFARLPRANL
ncbi:DUF6478 family protein [Phaeobacter sp. HF9A]|uniref:DUF6478 family protein n=1 Tax=Phaeobacter sp. HF9A TaxID=2721561 RepID=UPI0014317445|nr:DUF6478 family protein [Phaeobacter sp. HF9A]NIZ14772.1 hypothetical protein [Phaeobacter sp. HF9A]